MNSISIERHQAEIRRAANDDKLAKISSNLNGEDKLDAWVIEGRRIIPLLKRMAPKTAVSDVADKVARYQVKQNQLEQQQLTVKRSFESEASVNIVNLPPRKRVNSTESSNSKRRYQITSSSTKSNKSNPQQRLVAGRAQQGLSTTITIPSLNAQTQRTESTTICTTNSTLNDTKPKLLIMSTAGSMVNKPIVNNTVQNSLALNQHQTTSTLSTADHHHHHQLINVDSRVDLEDASKSRCSSSNDTSVSQATINQLITSASTTGTKIYNPQVQSTSSPKLMILPNSGSGGGQQTKTLTIPISHNVKTLQLPAQNSTILYSTQQPMVSSTALNSSNSTIKTTMPSIQGITIQAIKTQGGNKSNNQFIIMPNKTANNVSGSSQAKGLLRQMNAKEFPLKFIQTTTTTSKDHQNDKAGDSGETTSTTSQPTIILTNVSKETVNNLASTSSPIRNLIKNQNLSGHPNIIKVIPKCTNLTANSIQNSMTSKAGNTKTSPNQKITIPAGTTAATFMEILKNIPINRISSPQSAPSDASKTTINITQNPNSSLTKTNVIKIPANATTESITKLIFSNVMSNNSMNSNLINSTQSTNNATTAINSGHTSVMTSSSSTVPIVSTSPSDAKKITLITKTNSSPVDAQKQPVERSESVKEECKPIGKVDTAALSDESVSVEIEKALDNLSKDDLKSVDDDVIPKSESVTESRSELTS